MSKERKLIEAALTKKPLEVKAIVEELMQEKAYGVLAEQVDHFAPLDELSEEEELEAFFQEFHEEYGHLPLEEQEQIMNSLMEDADHEEELTEEETVQFAFFDMFEEAFGDLSEEEQEQIMDELVAELDEEYDADESVEAFISKAGAKIQTKAASGKKGEGEPMKTASKKQPRNHVPDVK